MNFLDNVSHAISNSTLGLLNKYPVICEKFSGFCGLGGNFFDDHQRTLLTATLATSAIAAVGGLFGMYLNRTGSFATNAVFLTTSALGAAAFYSQYQFLVLWVSQEL
ncbi:MAG: hypothetical protein KR126chlam4_00473 [Candidatus Anoxychlamydiales bacterium]|uniref:Uncharacterized protein n=1 Tax=marine sediment metagenome TaxID=412755 RepID=A0A0F9DVH8_9ZZZZ|nr:hypothetical protein [Candidatus Anoxychlamydiales bacterium]HEU64777.1 hypothetical protein [Chlamydiota bacterium]